MTLVPWFSQNPSSWFPRAPFQVAQTENTETILPITKTAEAKFAKATCAKVEFAKANVAEATFDKAKFSTSRTTCAEAKFAKATFAKAECSNVTRLLETISHGLAGIVSKFPSLQQPILGHMLCMVNGWIGR